MKYHSFLYQKKGGVIFCMLVMIMMMGACSQDIQEEDIPDPYAADEDIIAITFNLTQISKTNETKIFSESEIITIESEKMFEFHYAIYNAYDSKRCFYVQPICMMTMTASDCDMKSMTTGSDYLFRWFNISKYHIIKPETLHTSKAFILGEGERDEYIVKLILWSSRVHTDSCLDRIAFRSGEQMIKESEINLRIILM